MRLRRKITLCFSRPMSNLSVVSGSGSKLTCCTACMPTSMAKQSSTMRSPPSPTCPTPTQYRYRAIIVGLVPVDHPLLQPRSQRDCLCRLSFGPPSENAILHVAGHELVKVLLLCFWSASRKNGARTVTRRNGCLSAVSLLCLSSLG